MDCPSALSFPFAYAGFPVVLAGGLLGHSASASYLVAALSNEAEAVVPLADAGWEVFKMIGFFLFLRRNGTNSWHDSMLFAGIRTLQVKNEDGIANPIVKGAEG